MKDYNKAIHYYIKILKIDPTDYNAYNNIGFALSKLEKYKRKKKLANAFYQLAEAADALNNPERNLAIEKLFNDTTRMLRAEKAEEDARRGKRHKPGETIHMMSTEDTSNKRRHYNAKAMRAYG